jgi:hypothetical protein
MRGFASRRRRLSDAGSNAIVTKPTSVLISQMSSPPCVQLVPNGEEAMVLSAIIVDLGMTSNDLIAELISMRCCEGSSTRDFAIDSV